MRAQVCPLCVCVCVGTRACECVSSLGGAVWFRQHMFTELKERRASAPFGKTRGKTLRFCSLMARGVCVLLIYGTREKHLCECARVCLRGVCVCVCVRPV